MKESYIYKDGNVIITDVKENIFTDNILSKEIRPYQDNIDKILINENIIEYLNNLKNDINFDIESAQYYVDEGKKILKVCIPVAITATIIIGIICNMMLNNILLSGILSSLVTSILFGKILIYDPIKVIQESKKSIKIQEVELQELEKELEKVLKETQKLEQNKEKLKEEELKNNDSYKILNYKEKLKELREYLAMISFYEICKEQLTTYNEEGILEEKLKHEINTSQMKTLRRIINTKQYKTNEF